MVARKKKDGISSVSVNMDVDVDIILSKVDDADIIAEIQYRDIMDELIEDVDDETIMAEVVSRGLNRTGTRYSKRDLIDAINSGDKLHCGIVIAAIFGDGE
jgi:hypothetical protein